MKTDSGCPRLFKVKMLYDLDRARRRKRAGASGIGCQAWKLSWGYVIPYAAAPPPTPFTGWLHMAHEVLVAGIPLLDEMRRRAQSYSQHETHSSKCIGMHLSGHPEGPSPRSSKVKPRLRPRLRSLRLRRILHTDAMSCVSRLMHSLVRRW